MKQKPAPRLKKTAKAKARPPRKESENDRKARIVAAAMALAAEQGWPAVNSADVARRTRLKRSEVAELMPERTDILRHLGVMVDEAMAAEGRPEGSARDRLFEVMMRRFDALAPHQAGVRAVAAAWPGEPLLPLALASSFSAAMSTTLQTAGIEDTPLRKLAFSVVALSILRIWLEDDSADAARTMAALDRRLGQLEEAAQALAPLLGKN